MDRNGYIGRSPGDSSVIIASQTFEPTGIQTNFTFTSGHHPLSKFEFNAFQERYIKFFGKPPNREAIRAYDLTLDLVLRIVYAGKLNSSAENIEETEYQENRFWYKKIEKNGFVNTAFYLLRHKEYDIYEIKK